MSAKMTQRRRQLDNKRSTSINNEYTNGNPTVVAAAAAARRRNQHRHYTSSNRSRLEYLVKNLMKKKFPIAIPSYLITIFIGLGMAFLLYRLALTVIDYRSQYEYTNVPIKLPKLVNVNDTTAKISPQRFWGTYRSNLYFGVKHRSARSLSGGLMWFDYSKIQHSPDRFLRHWCDQNDRLKYGWNYHDGETFGIEQIYDDNLHLNIQWLKQITGEHGGDWTTRITVTPQTVNRTIPISLFFYFHHDLPWIDEINSISSQTPDLITLRGQTNELDGFTIKIKLNSNSNHLITRTLTDVFQLDRIHEHVLTKLVTTNAQDQSYVILNEQPFKDFEHNTFFVQLTLKQPSYNEVFSFDIIYQSDSSNNEREQDLTGYYFNEEITRLQKQYDERFENIFQLKTKQNIDSKKIQFAKSTLSNLIGGISFFSGKQLVSKYNQKVPDEYWTANLYTAVPSRSFFPRGFLWDEGFHNLLIARWNKNITIEILSHWFDLLNDNGWIPREVILGNEARARVPAEFIVQYTNNGNPPTFFLTIEYLLKSTSNNNLFTLPFIQRVEQWYQWYNQTQSGSLPFSYRWRGRNASAIHELNPKTLTSGLDDYPRASHPTDSERHIDLRCWMTLASNVLGKLYSFVNEEQANKYSNYANLLLNEEHLDQLHWSEQYGMYADYGLHTDHVQLQRVPIGKPNPQQAQQTHMIRQVTKQNDLNPKFVKHFGYVSLFPLMTRVLNPQSSKLEKVLNDLQNPNLLWTQFGLRSLAQSSSLYGVRNTEHDPPYWRGAIWINMNYMVLSALQHYAKTPGPYADKARQIYAQLRTNLITNMYRVYEKTGHIWEQYDDKTGNGQGSHPFTGWSSLIVLIMSELYDE